MVGYKICFFIQGHQVAGGELKAFSDMLEFTTLGKICN